jgi:hypothetical protein
MNEEAMDPTSEFNPFRDPAHRRLSDEAWHELMQAAFGSTGVAAVEQRDRVAPHAPADRRALLPRILLSASLAAMLAVLPLAMRPAATETPPASALPAVPEPATTVDGTTEQAFALVDEFVAQPNEATPAPQLFAPEAAEHDRFDRLRSSGATHAFAERSTPVSSRVRKKGSAGLVTEDAAMPRTI